MITNLKQKAKDDLQGNWLYSIVVMIVFSFIVSAVVSVSYIFMIPMFVASMSESSETIVVTTVVSITLMYVFLIAASFFLFPHLEMGYYKYHMLLGRREDADISVVFDGFKKKYWLRAKGAMLVFVYSIGWLLPYIVILSIAMILFTLEMPLIGALTFVLSFVAYIYAIVKVLGYSMISYLLIDDQVEFETAKEYIMESIRIMEGHKWELILTGLSFILWFILVVITFGLASFYVYPYMQQTFANFYLEISDTNPKGLVDAPTEDEFDIFDL